MCAVVPLFDAYQDAENGDERAILCHELGHAVAWFSFEGAVGSIKMEHEAIETGVEADILLLPRDGRKVTEETEAYRIPCTVRLLAGDVAYRREMGKREGMISLRGFCNRDGDTPEEILQKLERDHRTDDDLYKILNKALQAAPLEPEEWLTVRLQEAITCVNTNWEAITAIADRLGERAPMVGQEIWVPGTNLIWWMKSAGVRPGKSPALELLHSGDATNCNIEMLRFIRCLMGVHQVLRIQ